MEGREETWGRDTASPSAPHHQHVRDPSKGQSSRKKYPALTASQLVLDILLGKGKFLLYFLLPYSSFLSWRNVSLPYLLLYPPCYAHTHTHIHKKKKKKYLKATNTQR